ncbi:exported hypothetical protein [Cupriavidus taiwanensis]|nr:exported hypothetical protein [Cupriavidus taiwanensis]
MPRRPLRRPRQRPGARGSVCAASSLARHAVIGWRNARFAWRGSGELWWNCGGKPNTSKTWPSITRVAGCAVPVQPRYFSHISRTIGSGGGAGAKPATLANTPAMRRLNESRSFVGPGEALAISRMVCSCSAERPAIAHHRSSGLALGRASIGHLLADATGLAHRRAALAAVRVHGRLERCQADPRDHVDEALGIAVAMRQVGADQRLDHVRHLLLCERGADDAADRRAAAAVLALGAVLPAAQGDLVPGLAGLVDAEDADMADMMMPARVDAARDVEVELADVVHVV